MNNVEIITLKAPDIRDFALERNKLLKSSGSAWVFFVDSYEKISEELKKEIENLDPGNFNGFYIKRKIIFLGHEIGEDKVLRLGKRDAGEWNRKVHEVWNIKGKVGVLKNFLIHNTAEDISSYVGKINKYSGMHAEENLREGKKTNILKIILYPKMMFIKNILQGRGFAFSMLQSFHSFLGWSKEWELTRKTGQAK